VVLNPLEALGAFAAELVKSGRVQAWVRLGVSIAASSFVTGLGSWGIAVLAGESPLRACAIAAIAISVCVISLWTRSPLTKGIPLCRPGRIEARRIEMLTTENPVSWGTEKEK